MLDARRHGRDPPALPSAPSKPSTVERLLLTVDTLPAPVVRSWGCCEMDSDFRPTSDVDCIAKKATTRIELLQGTLDVLVLRALVFGPLHGHAIATHIKRTSEDVLHVDHGSL